MTTITSQRHHNNDHGNDNNNNNKNNTTAFWVTLEVLALPFLITTFGYSIYIYIYMYISIYIYIFIYIWVSCFVPRDIYDADYLEKDVEKCATLHVKQTTGSRTAVLLECWAQQEPKWGKFCPSMGPYGFQ